MDTTEKREREYARVAVTLNVRFRPVESDDEAEGIAEALSKTPSVWAPPGESELWKLADSPTSGSDGLLATAILALTAQVERLNRQLLDTGGPMEIGEISDLSCGGARFSTKLMLSKGSRLLLSLVGTITRSHRYASSPRWCISRGLTAVSTASPLPLSILLIKNDLRVISTACSGVN